MSQKFSKISTSSEFERDLKKMLKRFRSLQDDLKNFTDTQLFLFHKCGIDNGGILPINNLGFQDLKFYKAKKFACKALKGSHSRSGIRVIYTYLPEGDEIHFLEIYYKGDKSVEDRRRIERYSTLKTS